MVEALVNWGPLIVILAIVAAFTLRQRADYREHVNEVTQINREILELNRRNNDLAREQIEVLKEIKSLLEDRKA